MVFSKKPKKQTPPKTTLDIRSLRDLSKGPLKVLHGVSS